MSDPINIGDLVGGGWRALSFQPFRDGIDIHHIYDEGPGGPAAAVLRYAPGAGAPRHLHTGYEHVLILEGSQRDELGVYGIGAFTVNPPGFSHRVWSPDGCVALLIWQQPVAFVGEA